MDDPVAPELSLAKPFDKVPAKGEGGAGGASERKNARRASLSETSRARGVGVGEREVRVEGGGDGESTAITEDGCAIGTGSRALGLKAGTDTTGGAGGFEGVGMGARRW